MLLLLSLRLSMDNWICSEQFINIQDPHNFNWAGEMSNAICSSLQTNKKYIQFPSILFSFLQVLICLNKMPDTSKIE